MQLNYALIAKCHEARTRQEEEDAEYEESEDSDRPGTSESDRGEAGSKSRPRGGPSAFDSVGGRRNRQSPRGSINAQGDSME